MAKVLKAINVQTLTAQAEAARHPIQQFCSDLDSASVSQRDILRSDPGYSRLKTAVTADFTSLATAMGVAGIDPHDALRDAGITANS